MVAGAEKGAFMRNPLLKSMVVLGIAVLAGLSLLSTPASAAGACATSSTHLSISAASPGWPVGVFTDVMNCSDQKQRYTVQRTFKSFCDVTIPISNSRLVFQAHQGYTVSTSWYVPSDTCTGLGTVTSTVSAGGTILSTSSAPLTIQ